MDPEVSVLLHCAAWRGLRESQVQVELSDRFNRQTDEALERHIEEVWTQRVSREPWLFNGAKFRLHSFSLALPEEPLPSLSVFSSPNEPPSTLPAQSPSLDCAGDNSVSPHSDQRRDAFLSNSTTQNLEKGHGPVGVFQGYNADSTVQPSRISNEKKENAPVKPYPTSDCNAPEGVTTNSSSFPHRNMDLRKAGSVLLTLRLGLTCYKDFLGTNWSRQAGGLRSRGEAEFGDPLALLAQPLGVGGVLCTRDGQVVLIRRSQKVAEAGGLLDIPGGHPEPKAVCEGLDQGTSEDQINIAMLQQRQGAVISELFSSVCAEIRDEVNVPLSSLGEPVLMGIALNHTSAGRPSAEFYLSCSLTSDEVKELYWRGGLEAHESTDIVFLSRMDILQLDRDRPLWSELCPSSKGAVLLYQLVLPDEEQDSCSPSQTHITL